MELTRCQFAYHSWDHAKGTSWVKVIVPVQQQPIAPKAAAVRGATAWAGRQHGRQAVVDMCSGTIRCEVA
jgi:hypothetical protein